MFKHKNGLQDSQNNLTPDQKREYLHILLTEGKAAARAYLEQTDCEGGTFIYHSREEAETFQRHLENCCAGTKAGQWFFIPENRAVSFQPETEHPFISYFP